MGEMKSEIGERIWVDNWDGYEFEAEIVQLVARGGGLPLSAVIWFGDDFLEAIAYWDGREWSMNECHSTIVALRLFGFDNVGPDMKHEINRVGEFMSGFGYRKRDTRTVQYETREEFMVYHGFSE